MFCDKNCTRIKASDISETFAKAKVKITCIIRTGL